MSSVVLETKPKVRKRVTAQHSFTLRCLAYRHANSYIAECIDLNLLVKRGSIDEAASSLEDAIRGYLSVVLDNPRDMETFARIGRVEGLIPRPSPFTHRLRYHICCLKAAFVCGNQRNFQLNEYPSSRFAACC